MKRATSIYLDLLRCIAAFGVLLGHASFPWFAGEDNHFPTLGHELVIVFFFLSGYVIADATLRQPRPAAAYVAARLSRLYSVVGPAVLLTAILLRVGTAMAPAFYTNFTRAHEGWREIVSACFGQELWFVSASPPSNEPLWSLGYEFWYYAIFGCWVFARTCRSRWWLAGAAAVVAGPKILLLFPIWLLGVACWRMRERSWFGSGVARVGFLVSLGAIVVLIASSWAFPGGLTAQAPWFYSGRFVSDWLLGLAIGANVYCFDHGFGNTAIHGLIERPIRAVAGTTFSLYAYHFAILVFLAAVIPYDRTSRVHVIGVLLLATGIIVALQRLTEAQRPRLRRAIERGLSRRFGIGSAATATDKRPITHHVS